MSVTVCITCTCLIKNLLFSIIYIMINASQLLPALINLCLYSINLIKLRV